MCIIMKVFTQVILVVRMHEYLGNRLFGRVANDSANCLDQVSKLDTR